MARTIFLAPDAAVAGEGSLTTLQQKQADLQRQIEELKGRKTATPPDQYAGELERLLLELARVSQQIRAKS